MVQNLIGDQDILDSTKIDIEVFAKIVAQTGATVDSFESFAKNEYHSQSVLAIGILRHHESIFSFCASHRVSKLGALAQALITLGLVNSLAHPEHLEQLI